MIFPLFRRKRPDSTISALYGTIVAQARHAVFYRDHGVPDTLEGRFDMLVLHVALLLRRLEREPEEVKSVGQAVFDLFCIDLDDNLRELGASDVAVPRKMRRMGEAYFGRSAAYGRALAVDTDEALKAALARNVLQGGDPASPAAGFLARYVRTAAASLDALAGAEIARAAVKFPDPATISALEAT